MFIYRNKSAKLSGLWRDRGNVMFLLKRTGKVLLFCVCVLVGARVMFECYQRGKKTKKNIKESRK